MDWQTIISLVIVATAIGFIARSFFGSLRAVGSINSCGSGGCSTCPANEQNSRGPKHIELVRLDNQKKAKAKR